MNEQIRKSPVRLIDENEQMVGVVDVQEALRRARDVGLDLVEVAADSDPPVCRIRDYGKFKYELSKKEKANKQKSKSLEMKEVRLGRSMKIDQHDIEIRMNQARKFLLEGHKVQIVQNFRGREMQHKGRGEERLNDISERLSDIARVETPPKMAGRRISMILAPDRAKVEQFKRKNQPAKRNQNEDEESETSGERLNIPEIQTDEERSERPEAVDANAERSD